MSDEHPTDEATDGSVRNENWSCDGPAVIEASLDHGRVEIALVDELTEVELELRTDPDQERWSRGLSGLLNRLGEAGGPDGSFRIGGRKFSLGGSDFPFGGKGFDLSALSDLANVKLADEAVRGTEVSWTEQSRRLTVHSPARMPLRIVPLVLSVRAPTLSRLNLRTGMGRVTVTGRSGHVDVHTGSGDIELDVLDGQAILKSGSGDIALGAVRADVRAKTGSGDLRVADLESGRLNLGTGSGDLTIAVHAGVAAKLDLRSGSGRAHSELEVSGTAPSDGSSTVSVQGGTGSGDVLVTRALTAAGATG